MHQHIRHPLQRVADLLLHLVADVMGLPHGDVRVHFQVKIDMVAEAGFPGEALLDAAHAVNALLREGGLERYRQRPKLEGDRLVWETPSGDAADTAIVRTAPRSVRSSGDSVMRDSSGAEKTGLRRPCGTSPTRGGHRAAVSGG